MSIVLDKSRIKDFFDKASFKSWPYFREAWDEPQDISRPVLSARERLFFGQILAEGR